MYNEVQTEPFDSLVGRYAPLVKRIAHHMVARMPSSVQLEDLLQAGMIGLLEAARNYDAGKGASFETYAGIRIRGAMIDDVRKGDWAPRSVHRNARRVADAIKAVESVLGRDASDQEVASHLQVDLEDYYAMLQDSAGSRLFSFDDLGKTAGEDDSGGGSERIAGDSPDPGDEIQEANLRQQLAREISQLPERERLVLSLYYDEELNLKEIGLVLGVSESRVSQIHSQAALRLRSRLKGWAGNE
jgi:RNA polymerase sigma factor for flagellar operon FliA